MFYKQKQCEQTSHWSSAPFIIFKSLKIVCSILGYAAIPAGGGGTFLGGYLVKKFDLHVKGIIRLCLGLTICVLLLMLVFLVNCGNNPFAGVNVKYGSTAENRFVDTRTLTAKIFIIIL